MRFFALFLLTAAGAANAGIATIDAATFPVGTDITTATPGVTLNTLTNYGLASGYALRPVFSVANTAGVDAGLNLLGHNLPPSLPWDFRNAWDEVHLCWTGGRCVYDDEWSGFKTLLLSFEYPTNFLEMRVHRGFDELDWSYLRLYNRQRQMIANCYVSGTNTTRVPYYVPATPGKGLPCGDIVRHYDCVGSGLDCKAEIRVTINRAYPDIAYAIFGGEAYNSNRGAINRISFRRFGDCKP